MNGEQVPGTFFQPTIGDSRSGESISVSNVPFKHSHAPTDAAQSLPTDSLLAHSTRQFAIDAEWYKQIAHALHSVCPVTIKFHISLGLVAKLSSHVNVRRLGWSVGGRSFCR